MAKVSDRNFIRIVDSETGDETYKIQFDYGTQKIDVKEGSKITLDYVHGGFENYFKRVGNDLVIGDDIYLYMAEPLGVGHGKEVWSVSVDENKSYSINVQKYNWLGSYYGYEETPSKTETKIMTEAEYVEFQSDNEVVLNIGENTLYTTWAVLPDPVIHYHMKDSGYYAPANGKIILKDYFLNGKDSVYVGDKLLSDIIKESPMYSALIKSNSKKPYNLFDTFFDDNLYGGDRGDKIHSYMADDMIDAGKGNDKIYLAGGNKTIMLAQGDGKDTVYGAGKTDSVRFKSDTDNVYFTKSKNDLLLNRDYFDKTEQTVIKDYFKDVDNSNISVNNGDIELVSNFTQQWKNGEVYLRATGSKVIRGTDGNDEAFSSVKNETFILGQGNDVIRFRNNGAISYTPYSFGKDVVKLEKGSHVTLDFSDVGGKLSYTKKGNDAIITARHQIELCGRANGKEEWVVKKGSKGTYNVTKTTYNFTGDGYSSNNDTEETVMSKSEFKEFQEENGVKLKLGKNTLFTSWAVVPNPEIHYSMKDGANWGIILGTVTLKDYFKYGEDSVYIGETSLQEYFKDVVLTINKSKSKKGQVIEDTIYNEVIYGSKKSDRIFSYYGNDEITAGKGNDEIYLAQGNKVVNINKGDGTDTIKVSKSTGSVQIAFDLIDSMSFDRDKNDMVIIRSYGDKTERTIIKNYFVMNLDNNIVVSSPELYQELSEDVVGLTTEVTCRYPLVDDPKPEIICSYPPVDAEIPEVPVPMEVMSVPTVDLNVVNQDVSAWQSAGSDVVIENVVTSDYQNMSVLVVGQ